jgi:hypothetical protein
MMIIVFKYSALANLEQGVCQGCGLARSIKKYLKAKEELWKFKYFSMQKQNSSKESSKRNQNL